MENIPRLLITGGRSGSGKTVATCGILSILRRRGLAVAGFKCGPDYIDPMFHREVLGVGSGNLDGFFQSPEQMRESFLEGCLDVGRRMGRARADIGVIEGVMGYFDGLGGTTARASSWETAGWLDSPVIFVADGRGASLSLAAELQGFLEFCPYGPEALGIRMNAGVQAAGMNAGVRAAGMNAGVQAAGMNASVQAAGMNVSVQAAGMNADIQMAGMQKNREKNGIRGILLNRVSAGMYPALKEMLEERFSVPVVGYIPKLDWLELKSRHLGLMLPGEIGDLKQQMDRLARELEQTMDVEALLAIASEGVSGVSSPAEPGPSPGEWKQEGGKCRKIQRYGEPQPTPSPIQKSKEPQPTPSPIRKCKEPQSAAGSIRKEIPPVIAIARDEAFCFYYQDNLRLLERLGAKLVFFSPLHDRRLPEGAGGLLFGGGYPELYARRLSENVRIRQQIARAAQEGMPILGECGGFLYLQASLEDEHGISFPMVGALPGNGYRTGKLVRFGYVVLQNRNGGQRDSQRDREESEMEGYLGEDDSWNEGGCPEDGQIGLRDGERILAHEFHYWDSDCCGERMTASKPVGNRSWHCMQQRGNVLAGFPHLYYPSCVNFADRFVSAVRQAYSGISFSK